jgi:hypothetical protein
VGLGGYSSTSLPHMVWLLGMKWNKEEIKALKKNWRLLTRMLSEDLRRRNSLHEQYEKTVKNIID